MGSMLARLAACAAVPLALLLVPPPSEAAVCVSPFGDVSDDASYCDAAIWLKDRSITVGCSDATHFCPEDAVTRAQMALFMKRLGIALEPTFLYRSDTFSMSPTPNVRACETGDYGAKDFNRVATVDASSFLTGTGTGFAQIYYSLDGGTWTTASDYMVVTVAAGAAGAANVSRALRIPAGHTMNFALVVSATTTMLSGSCDLRVRIENYNYAVPF